VKVGNWKWAGLITACAALAGVPYMGARGQSAGTGSARYQVVNLGTLSGPSSEGNTINNIGWSMGSGTQAGNITEHATVWIYGLRFDLGTLGGPNSDVQWPVKNDHGLVAGISETAALDPYNESWSCTAFTFTQVPTGHVCVGFVWQWGVMNALPTLGGNNGFAAGANNLGEIAGWAERTVHDPTCVLPQVLQFEPVVYGPSIGQIKQLPNHPGDPDGAATAINDAGQIVGISGICDNAVGALTAEHALLWENGNVIDLGNLGGKGWNTPMAISRRGDIVGFSDLPGDYVDGTLTPNFHAFIWTKESGKMTDLGVLPGDSLSEALDINDQGQVVGLSIPSLHAFIYENGKMTDLNSLIPSGSPLLLLAANGINDRGEITGQACIIADGGCPASDQTPAFLAFPVHGGDGSDSPAMSAPEIAVPDTVRDKIMRRMMFGHTAPEKVAPN
jgi:probable HAF family extracellular repeat protein